MAKTEAVRVFDSLMNLPPSPSITFDPEEGKTLQEFKEECDINTIMKRHTTMGIEPQYTGDVGSYEDFAGAPDFHQAMEIVAKSKEQFAALSAPVRARFGNDPGAFLAFVGDPANLEEAEKLGLLSEEAAKRRGDERAVKAARAQRAEEALAAAEAAAKKGGDAK